ncbi:YciI family protein [Methylocapsa sp. D3K7]|uniref:YciI family protein n=1 Tax=Methylocapsa sp. D3K7 TaxID=3041435 RepID=UPI00244EC5B4|nr:YciI family protein [Methylocapsa sp. D3K7]WGJ16324.1 YciI family protein [Methylocapsa sp. D3K7]
MNCLRALSSPGMATEGRSTRFKSLSARRERQHLELGPDEATIEDPGDDPENLLQYPPLYPAPPTEEQIAGYWLWEVKSMDEAVEWLKRCPNPMLVDSDIEIRPEFEVADFAG